MLSLCVPYVFPVFSYGSTSIIPPLAFSPPFRHGAQHGDSGAGRVQGLGRLGPGGAKIIIIMIMIIVIVVIIIIMVLVTIII